MQNFDKKTFTKLPGQTLVEVILAVALLAIFASTLAVYLNNQLAYMTRGQSALEAIYLAQEGLEASRSIRDTGWEYLATGTHGLLYDASSWSYAGTHELIGKFTRTISIADLSDSERQVISLVSWPGTAGVRSIALATNLADWRDIGEEYEYVSRCYNFNDYSFYIPFKDSASGDYPAFGSSVDQATLSPANNVSNGYVNISLGFSGIPEGFRNADLFMDFTDLDLFVDQYLISGNSITLQENFTLFDINNNQLAHLDGSYGQSDKFTWQYPISNSILTPGNFTLKTKFGSTLSLLSGSGLTVSNSLDGMSDIRLCGSQIVPELYTSGDWSNPQTLGSINLGPGSTPTGLVVRNGIVYMSSVASSADKHDFFVVDATNGASPVIAGSINTGPGLNDVSIAGNFAFLANQDSANHLQIANITDPYNPYLIHSYRLSGNTAQALSVAATGTLVLVGTASNSGPELYLVNVANLTAPMVMASFEVGASVNNIHIQDGMAYIATSHNSKEVIVLDISNPANPSIVANIDTPYSNDALGVFVNPQDDRMYVSRRASTASNSPEVVLYDVQNPVSPRFLGSLEFSNDVYSSYGADDLMFLASAYSSQEFRIYNAINPAQLLYWTGLNFPQVAVDMVMENNFVYVAVRSNDALRIITSQ